MTLHPFESAGLGVAPFRFDGCARNWFTAYPGDPGKPGGSCDYCGTGIAMEYWVVSADGKRFKVGSNCVEKLAKANNVAFAGDRLLCDIRRAESNEKARIRAAREAEKKAALRVAFAEWYSESRKSAASALPHPAIPGKSLADYIEWMIDNRFVLTPSRFPMLESF